MKVSPNAYALHFLNASCVPVYIYRIASYLFASIDASGLSLLQVIYMVSKASDAIANIHNNLVCVYTVFASVLAAP